jgi:hypothetical protein
MTAVKLLKHFFTPHESNNQKAKLLHTDTLSLLIILLLGFHFVLNIAPQKLPSVLGYAANISPAEVINLTNNERVSHGLSPLQENKALDSAALAKGNDMLAKGYWAHFAPDGTTPWSFFLSFGYKYQYAGENLARDFSSAGGAVSAWMNSPTHKENILNPHYKEVGIGVVDGSLSGTDTTIVVQFFAAPLGGAPSIPIAKAEDVARERPISVSSDEPKETPKPSPTPEIVPTGTPVAVIGVSENVSEPKISPFQATKSVSLGFLGLVLLALSIDLLIVRRNKIVRIGGRTLAHLAYLSMIMAVILLLKAGQII